MSLAAGARQAEPPTRCPGGSKGSLPRRRFAHATDAQNRAAIVAAKPFPQYAPLDGRAFPQKYPIRMHSPGARQMDRPETTVQDDRSIDVLVVDDDQEAVE